MQLNQPVHFVAPADVVWPELLDWDGSKIDDQVLSDRSGGILHSWVLRTYYQLRLIGEKVTLSDTLRQDAINIVSPRDFGRRQRDLRSFVVVPQGDAHHSRLANFRILQNGVRPLDDAAAVIWHWPQPGIVARDPSRGDRVERLCYKGRLLNLDERFRTDAFIADLQARGITFEIDAYSGLRGEHSWNDYANSDAVLAVRNLTHYDADKKPASKLVNAWFADIPALLGPEPAYRELGTPGKDYLEVRSASDALDAVISLRSNPDLFRSLIENGRTRRKAYTEPALTTLWLDTLNGPIAHHFARWQRRPALSRASEVVKGLIREPRARAYDKRALASGARLLDPVDPPEGPDRTGLSVDEPELNSQGQR